ncbi:Xanthine/uracil permease family protein [Rhynchospora pubera]|uniref:Xanthine/uracil permease family protein n=1 Tax=Rhynchospora pubera TaxID=906938 RepID=A0AAV8G0U6_9POAL|nr:Xanthine/uracil permease family protein [Rhynchospora pubera]
MKETVSFSLSYPKSKAHVNVIFANSTFPLSLSRPEIAFVHSLLLSSPPLLFSLLSFAPLRLSSKIILTLKSVKNMAEFKPEEPMHFYRPMDQLQGLEYCIDSNPSWLEAIALGFQHYVLSLGTTVMIPTMLVPLMGGSDDDKVRVVQTLLFVTGINTLLQTLIGTRLPTVIGGSFAFVVPIVSIMNDSSLANIPDDHQRFRETMRAIQGALIVSSSIQIILGFSQLWGICSRFFSPLGMVPVVALVGFGLFDRGFPVVPLLPLFTSVTVCILHVHLIVGTLVLTPCREMCGDWSSYAHFICCLISVFQMDLHKAYTCTGEICLVNIDSLHMGLCSYINGRWCIQNRPLHTQINCRTDRANLISSAPWIKIPYPLQWGPPTFDAGHCFGMMAAVVVSMVESTGAFKAAARLASATTPPAPVLSRGIGCQGLSILLDGLCGSLTGSSVSVENVGLLGSTRVGSRRVIQISAVFMIFFSILGKFGALFASIPFPIFAAVYCILFGIVAAVGLSYLQFTNMNSMRNLFIVGVSLFLGLSIPEYFDRYTIGAQHGPAHTKAGWFNDWINTTFASPPTVALIVAVILDNSLEFREAGRDRGMHWWAPFRTYRGDSRNEEFYGLPFNMRRFIPSY